VLYVKFYPHTILLLLLYQSCQVWLKHEFLFQVCKMYSISFYRFDTSNLFPVSWWSRIHPHFHLSWFFCLIFLFVVPPAYYAHLAAFRARYYIEGDASESGSASGGRGGFANFEVKLPSVKSNVSDVMFFCWRLKTFFFGKISVGSLVLHHLWSLHLFLLQTFWRLVLFSI